jgi:hypothetical protein
MDKKKLDRLERKVLRRDTQQAVEKKLDLHPTYPDDEEDKADEEDEDEEVDEDGEEIIQFLTLRLRGCEHDRENHLDCDCEKSLEKQSEQFILNEKQVVCSSCWDGRAK